MVIAITEECMVFKLSVQKPPNKPITVALPELPPITHLAVGEGCGGTSLALQYARNTLIDGGRVIWVCEKSPDSQRFSQILNDVDVVFSALITSNQKVVRLDITMNDPLFVHFLNSVDLPTPHEKNSQSRINVQRKGKIELGPDSVSNMHATDLSRNSRMIALTI